MSGLAPEDAPSRPRHGRRANPQPEAEGDAPKPKMTGWTEVSDAQAAAPIQEALPTVDNQPDYVPQEAPQLEDLSKEVADAPTGYQTHMPRLTELDAKGNWTMPVTKESEDLDLTPLTAVLCTQLDDEDVPWNPDSLMLQLAAELAPPPEPDELSPEQRTIDESQQQPGMT